MTHVPHHFVKKYSIVLANKPITEPLWIGAGLLKISVKSWVELVREHRDVMLSSHFYQTWPLDLAEGRSRINKVVVEHDFGIKLSIHTQVDISCLAVFTMGKGTVSKT